MPNLREALLPFTIRNAIGLPFYAKFWEGINVDEVLLPRDLRRLPTLSKVKYRQSMMFDPSSVVGAEYISHSTGTTGEVTWRHRTAAEAAIINELFGYGDEPTEGRQLALIIRYDRHGMSMPVPGRVRSIPIGLSDDAELKQSVKMLTAKYHFAEGDLRPTILVGSGPDLAILAHAFLETHTPPDESDIRLLQVLGVVDAGLYKFLHSAFNGAEVIERFSLSEIFGGATKQWPATSFLLDPHVVGEVVDESGAPVAPGGVGELVLTELFPFVQTQPLIRYRTGDVVLLVNEEDDRFEFEWWGRRHQCLMAHLNNIPSWVLGYRPVLDWLGLEPIVARHSYRTYLTSITSVDFDLPCVSLSLEPDSVVVKIDIGLRINPWFEPETVQRFSNELWAALKAMVCAPVQDIRVRLSFQHFLRPGIDFHTVGNAPSLQLATKLLSSTAPTLLN
jgi:hypothetical protein